MDKDLENRLRRIEDEMALQRLINVYHKTADAFDWKGWSECFAEDAVFVNQFGVHRGRQEIYDRCRKRFGTVFRVFQHVIVNACFDIAGDTASGTGNLLFVGLREGNRKNHYFLAGGRYEWAFVRTPEAWIIKTGTLTFLWDNSTSN